MIPYEDLARLNEPFNAAFEEKFKQVLKKGWLILGQEVKDFEAEFAAYHSAGYCVGVANGLDALILSLKVLDLPAGSEVIVPSNTYIATIIAILHAGHMPVFVEPDMVTYNIDPTKIEQAITAKTRAIMVVHLYGKCCDMDPILVLTKKYSLALIEDCAQSHDARYKGKLAGTFGDAAGFSFYPTKNLGALGDAGAVLCNDEEIARQLKRMRNYGSEIKYHNDVVGYNSRLDEVQAAFLRIKLQHLEAITTHKRKLAGLYHQHLKTDFIKPVVHQDYFDVYHIYNIRHAKRDELKAYLSKNEIATEIHYPVAPHHQKALKGILDPSVQYPISEEIHRTTLSIPCSFCHTEDEILRVIDVLNKF